MEVVARVSKVWRQHVREREREREKEREEKEIKEKNSSCLVLYNLNTIIHKKYIKGFYILNLKYEPKLKPKQLSMLSPHIKVLNHAHVHPYLACSHPLGPKSNPNVAQPLSPRLQGHKD